MSERFLCLPLFLQKDSAWKNYSLKYRALFQFILSECVYKLYEYNLNGMILNLKPGQMITTIRELTEKFNLTVKFKEDKLTKTTTARALDRFMCDKFVGHIPVQNAGHEKTLLTITNSRVYEIVFNQVGTDTGTHNDKIVGQERDNIKRTRNTNDKPRYTKDVHERSAPPITPFAHASVFSSDSRDSPKDLDLYTFANNYEFPNKERINEKVLTRWFGIYGPEEVYEAIRHYEKNNEVKFIPKPEAYMESSLKNRYWETSKLREKTKEREKHHEKEKKQRYS